MTVQDHAVGGPEAAARAARYAALQSEAAGRQATIWLGHTLDDQAESVLLGLARGSGPRSLAGMAARDRPAGPAPARSAPGGDRAGLRRARVSTRGTTRTTTTSGSPAYASAAPCCPPWRPSSGPGVAEALVRTAALARDDADLLDVLAAEADPGTDTLDTAALLDRPAALRTRVIRRWLLRHGAAEVTARHVGVGRRAGHPLARAGRNSPARCQSHPSGWEPALPA